MTVVAGSDPYPWPWDGDLDPARTALVIAGAQPVWGERSQRTAAVTAVILAVAEALRAGGGSVVALRHLGPPGGTPGPRPALPPPVCGDGAEPAPVAAAADLVVACGGTNGFYAGPLDVELRRRRIRRLVLCGYGAEATVDSTLRSANDRGYECLTLLDGVAPFAESTGRHALCSITMSGGIFGAIGTSAALLTALDRSLRTEETP